ncbi:MAG TPA: bifunctional adenosylcobinamide kinase/adenosylcobinamide-phosphate guanylyltransferase [Desulfomicrobiaceae bacterium]|nr:bifunctional adenosylcobinamide kinase/adenosylcobinamide-phosphate guanylyltransferase [Desulfomicrobiaceae bacterium]
MKNSRLTMLVTGGCRSGKSLHGERVAESYGPRCVYVATAQVWDTEMADRVEGHRARRGKGWTTVEEPRDVVGVLREHGQSCDAILVDCVTLWLTNLMLADLPDADIMERVHDLTREIRQCRASVILVSNEVGWGIVPENKMARRFRDLAGGANAVLAEAVDNVVLCVAGIPMAAKGAVGL